MKLRILQSESCELVRYDIHHALPNNTNSMIGRLGIFKTLFKKEHFVYCDFPGPPTLLFLTRSCSLRSSLLSPS